MGHPARLTMRRVPDFLSFFTFSNQNKRIGTGPLVPNSFPVSLWKMMGVSYPVNICVCVCVFCIYIYICIFCSFFILLSQATCKSREQNCLRVWWGGWGGVGGGVVVVKTQINFQSINVMLQIQSVI